MRRLYQYEATTPTPVSLLLGNKVHSTGWFTEPELLFNPIVAEFYDLFAWPFVTATTKAIMKELTGVDGEILEIGCGTGLVTTELAKVGKVTSVEPSSSMLEKARGRIKRYNLEDKVCFIQDRAESLPLPSTQFDAIVMSYVLRYIKPQALETVASEITRVLKPGGRLLLADLHLPLTGAFPKGIGRTNPNYMVLGILAIYDPASLARYIENFGFKFRSLQYYPLSFLLILSYGG